MKRKTLCSLIGFIILFAAGPSHAQGVKFSRLGVNGSLSLGGDIGDSNVGFGAQTDLSINRHVSIELALSHFSDEIDRDRAIYDIDMTTIGVSAVFRAPLATNIHGYMLGGLDYNIPDVDASPAPNWSFMAMSADVDSAIGFHLGAGLDFTLQKNLELFTEYRYTFLDLDGDLTWTIPAGGVPGSQSIDEDYDFGLLKIGINYLF